MNNAKIAQIGTPRELYDAPIDEFVADFIGEANLFDGVIDSIDAGMAIASVNGVSFTAAARELPVGAARIAIRPGRGRLSSANSVRSPSRLMPVAIWSTR